MDYKYNRDVKTTIWDKEHFTVEADSQEDADREAINLFRREQIEPDETETLWDSSEYMTIEENNGFATEQLYREGSNDELVGNTNELIKQEFYNKKYK